MSVTPTPNSMINAFTQTTAIPATTVFKPPSICTNPIPDIRGLAIHPYREGASACQPVASWVNYQVLSDLYLSPGVCPYKFNYVATSIQKPASSGGSAITLAVCCPPGYDHWEKKPGALNCHHVIEAQDSTGFWAPLFNGKGATVFDASASPSAHTLVGYTVYGLPISVAWQESDLPAFTPDSAPVKDLDRVHAFDSHNSGLSTGALAGIVVGAVIVVSILLLVLWRLSRRYQLIHRAEPDAPMELQPYYDDTHRLTSRPAAAAQARNAYPSNARSEGSQMPYTAVKDMPNSPRPGSAAPPYSPSPGVPYSRLPEEGTGMRYTQRSREYGSQLRRAELEDRNQPWRAGNGGWSQ